MLSPDEMSAQRMSGERSAVGDGDRTTVGVRERRISTSSPRSRNLGSFGENATIREHEVWRPARCTLRFSADFASERSSWAESVSATLTLGSAGIVQCRCEI